MSFPKIRRRAGDGWRCALLGLALSATGAGCTVDRTRGFGVGSAAGVGGAAGEPAGGAGGAAGARGVETAIDAAAAMPADTSTGAGPDTLSAVVGLDGGLPPPDARPPGLPFSVVSVATWRGGAEAAYSLVHDNVCDSTAVGAFTRADPELARRGLHAGFAAIVASCAGQWNAVKALVAHGHDVFNQSWNYPCLSTAADCARYGAPETDLATQIDQSTTVLAAATGRPVQFFAFPFDVCGADALARLRARGYVGARCGRGGINAPNFPDGFGSKQDAWGPAFSLHGSAGPCAGVVVAGRSTASSLPVACRRFVLTRHVEEVIQQKGWGIRTVNGFAEDANPDTFEPINLADYLDHLDYIKGKADAGALWVEGPTPVIKYRFARQACPLPTVAAGNTLRFSAPSADCTRYATVLSYLVATASPDTDPPALRLTQAGISLPARKVGPGRFIVDADPTRGDAVIGP
jgi:hypothetical protein